MSSDREFSSDPEMSSDGAAGRRELKLHPAAVAVGAVDAVRENVLPLAVLAGVALLGGGVTAESLARLAVYALLAAVIAAVVGYARWASTRYSLDEHSVGLRRGILQRQQAAVPVERISSIDTVQGPVHRVFGVTQLEVHAAGGGQEPEITLLALSDQAARDVRDHAARGGLAADREGEGPPLRVLSRRALVVAALTSGQVTLLLPVLAALAQSLDDVLGRGGGDALERYLPPDTVADALLALLVLLGVAWVLSIAGTIVAFSGFEVGRRGDRIRIMRGFLQRRVSNIPVARVQAVRVVEGVFRQPFGLVALRVESAGYANERSVNTTLFPLLPRAELPAFLDAVSPELSAPMGPLERPPGRAGWLYVGPITAVAVAAAVPLGLLVSPAALLLVPLAAMLGVLRQRASGWRLEDGFLVARSRRLARTTIIASGMRLPERTFAQGPLARRLDLGTLAFALASRTRWEVAHIEAPRVRALIDALRPPRRARTE
jgi:putative membrane protein